MRLNDVLRNCCQFEASATFLISSSSFKASILVFLCFSHIKAEIRRL